MMLISRQTDDASGAQYLKVGEGWLRAMEQSGLHTASRNGVIDGFLIQAKKFGNQGKVLVLCPTDYAMCCYIGADEKLHFAGIPASGATLAAMVDVLLGGDGEIDAPPPLSGSPAAIVDGDTLLDPSSDLPPIPSTASSAVPTALRFDHGDITATTDHIWMTGYAPALQSVEQRLFTPLSYSLGVPPAGGDATANMGFTWNALDEWVPAGEPLYMGPIYSRVGSSVVIGSLAKRV